MKATRLPAVLTFGMLLAMAAMSRCQPASETTSPDSAIAGTGGTADASVEPDAHGNEDAVPDRAAGDDVSLDALGGAAGAVPDSGDATIFDIGTDVAVDADTGDDSGTQFRCIQEWPDLPAAVPSASLSVAVGVAWTTVIPWLAFEAETAFTQGHLGIVGGNKLWMLDASGDVAGELLDSTSQVGRAAIADAAGRFFFPTSSLFAVSPTGVVDWQVPFGANLDPSNDTTYTSRLLMDPEGVLHFAASDGLLYAVRSSDGHVLWNKPIGLTSAQRVVFVASGVGDTFFAGERAYQRDSGVASDGPRVAGTIVGVYGGIYSGLLTGRWESTPSGLEMKSYMLDKCGQLLWGLPNANGSWEFSLTGYGETLLVVHRVNGVQDAYVYDPSGNPILGPVPLRGFPTTIGADGVIYTIECATDLYSDMTLRAYTSDLVESWTLPLGYRCTYGGTTLTDDGKLYVVRDLDEGIEVIAVQTTSPGLAKTALPTRQHDNQRSGWLASQ